VPQRVVEGSGIAPLQPWWRGTTYRASAWDALPPGSRAIARAGQNEVGDRTTRWRPARCVTSDSGLAFRGRARAACGVRASEERPL